MLTWTRGLGVLALGLGVLGLTVGEAVLAGDPLPPVPGAGNVNIIRNSGNGRSTTVIVEPGSDGRMYRSVFTQGECKSKQLLAQPTPLVPQQGPAVDPERVPVPPLPAEPQPLDPMAEPMPVVPALPATPDTTSPARDDRDDLILRIPLPRMPDLRMPASGTTVYNGPGGRTIVSSTGSNSTVIVGGNGRGTTVLNGPGLVYRGMDHFWTKTMYSKEVGAMVYYDPHTSLWFRYCKKDDTFRAVPDLDEDD